MEVEAFELGFKVALDEGELEGLNFIRSLDSPVPSRHSFCISCPWIVAMSHLDSADWPRGAHVTNVQTDC